METKTRARKAPARRVSGQKGKPRQKAPGKKSKAKKATARKTAAKKRAAKKTPAKKTTANKTTPNQASQEKREIGTPQTTADPARTAAPTATLQEKSKAAGAPPTQDKAKQDPGTNGNTSPPRLSPRSLSRGVWDTLTERLAQSDKDRAALDERPIGRWIAASFLSGCLVGWVLAALL